jgi:hypothetical protein
MARQIVSGKKRKRPRLKESRDARSNSPPESVCSVFVTGDSLPEPAEQEAYTITGACIGTLVAKTA